MNITWIKLRGIAKVLGSINNNLVRIADALEADLRDRNVPLKPPSVSKDRPEIFYTDEEEDFVRELEAQEKRMSGRLQERDPNEPE